MSEKTDYLVTELDNNNNKIKNKNNFLNIQQFINSMLSFF